MMTHAIHGGDANLATMVTARLHDILFSSLLPADAAAAAAAAPAAARYQLGAAPCVKSPSEFVGRRFDDPTPDHRTRKKMEGMLRWTEEEPHASLTRLADPADEAAAAAQFRRVLGFMGDRAAVHPDVLADECVMACRERPALCDETFAQVGC